MITPHPRLDPGSTPIIIRMRFRLGGRNERSSESRVRLAWTMPRFPNCVRLPVAFRDDIAECNEDHACRGVLPSPLGRHNIGGGVNPRDHVES